VNDGDQRKSPQAPTPNEGQKPVAGLVIGTAVSLTILAGAIYGSVMGIPYLWNRLTDPIAGPASNPDSFQGTWVGGITVKDEYSRSAFRPPEVTETGRAAMEITARTLGLWGAPKFQGDVYICDASGARTVGRYNNEALLQLPRLYLLLRSPGGFFLENDLRGTFHPGSIDVAWAVTDRTFLTGRLTKSSPAEFEALCHNLLGEQKMRAITQETRPLEISTRKLASGH
jgi:hypothetical protein